MSDDWGNDTPRRRQSSGTQTLLIIFVIVIANLAVTTYLLNSATNRMKNLDGEIDVLKMQLENAAYQIQSMSDQIDDIQISGSGTVFINSTGGYNLTDIYNRVADSVVMIQVVGSFSSGQGSGFVYDTSNTRGRIITNNHVVEDALEDGITVIFTDGTSTSATVLGTDPYSDLAVIEVDVPVSKLKPVRFAESSQLQVGEQVIALGNPFGLTNTMTSGIISALGRQLDAPSNYVIVDVIQTDAAINPGNSGGPLLNVKGEVIGMNTAIISSVEQYSGVGFAVPSDTISREVTDLIVMGDYEHPWLGITGITLYPALKERLDLDDEVRGLLITDVTGSPAQNAGLRGGSSSENVGGTNVEIGGDIIIGVDGKSIKDFNDLMVYLERNTESNREITLRIIRDGSEIYVDLILGTRPDP